MHGIVMKKLPGIQAIFERDNDGNYTKDALLYQDILYYSIVIEKENAEVKGSFKERELARWLIDYNQEFINDYKGSHKRTKYKIENRLPRIKGKIADLIGMFLIQRTGTDKAQKIDYDIPLYGYTKSTAIQKVHDIVNLYLSTKDASRSIFLSNFFQRCKDKGIFVNDPTYFLNSLGEIPPLYNEVSLLELFLDVPNTLYWVTTYPAIFIETLDNLDAEIKKALLFQFQMEIEVFYNNYYSTKRWEIMRYNNINNYSTVTVPGFCSGCNSEVPFQYDIINYLHSLSTMKMPYPSGIITTNCTKCGKEYCLSGRIMGVPWHAIVRT
jgi:hypothetical protein